MDLQVFEGVRSFRYLATLIHSKNLISDEIKLKIAADNSCFCSLRQILRSRAMSKTVKTEILGATQKFREFDHKKKVSYRNS